jgi:hypothetical protein
MIKSRFSAGVPHASTASKRYIEVRRVTRLGIADRVLTPRYRGNGGDHVWRSAYEERVVRSLAQYSDTQGRGRSFFSEHRGVACRSQMPKR